MAKKRKPGRPKGSKNKIKGKKKGGPTANAKTVTASNFLIQIQNLKMEKQKLLASAKQIDKAISLLGKLDR